MKRLTANETRLLRALVDAFSGPPDAGANYRSWKTHCRAMGNWFRPSDLQRFGFIDTDAPDSGLHRTAASLVRKGLVVGRKIQGIRHYQFTAEGRAAISPHLGGERVPADAPLERRRRPVSQRKASPVTVTTAELRSQKAGPAAPEPENPYWRADGSTRLAKIIQGVCSVTQTAAEQLAAEAVDSDAGVIFETETRVAGRAGLGIQPHRWLAVRKVELGSDFRLERLS